MSKIAANHMHRHNHYDPENVHHCRKCGAYVSPERETDGVLRYQCWRCGVTYEPVKTSLRSLKASANS